VSVVVGFLHILREMFFFFSSFEMVMFRKLILFPFSSFIVNFIVGIMLLNKLKTSCIFVVLFLYTIRISST
jgi:hypothetical protein